jgi:acyl-CoA hydrolase
MSAIQQTAINLHDHTPAWANWLAIAGGALMSWLAPVASIVAIVWGCLQIYGWFEARRHKRRK